MTSFILQPETWNVAQGNQLGNASIERSEESPPRVISTTLKSSTILQRNARCHWSNTTKIPVVIAENENRTALDPEQVISTSPKGQEIEAHERNAMAMELAKT